MQNDVQSSEIVILGVDTHLDIHVGAVSSLTGKLLDTHVIQTNQMNNWTCLIGPDLLGLLNKQASKERNRWYCTDTPSH